MIVYFNVSNVELSLINEKNAFTPYQTFNKYFYVRPVHEPVIGIFETLPLMIISTI